MLSGSALRGNTARAMDGGPGDPSRLDTAVGLA